MISSSVLLVEAHRDVITWISPYTTSRLLKVWDMIGILFAQLVRVEGWHIATTYLLDVTPIEDDDILCYVPESHDGPPLMDPHPLCNYRILTHRFLAPLHSGGKNNMGSILHSKTGLAHTRPIVNPHHCGFFIVPFDSAARGAHLDGLDTWVISLPSPN